jgi:hypothetical protein
MAIRLTESRLRQIIREEAARFTRGSRRLRESEDDDFERYFEVVKYDAENQEFFDRSSPKVSVARNIVMDTLAYEFDDEVAPEMVDRLVKALIALYKELKAGGYDGLGGGSSNDGSSYPSF